jgi:hypothetical protein
METEIAGTRSTHGTYEECEQNVAGKPEGSRQL